MKSFLTFAEALKGKQHKIDVDKDGKIEGEDLAKLRAMKKEEVEQIDEVEKATGGLKDACWKGYTAVGMKMKNGRKVPNCVPEETDLEEKMNLAKASMGDVIKDFKKSDAPQFAGKSVEKRREMAIAAKLSADRGVREEVEEGYIPPAKPKLTPSDSKTLNKVAALMAKEKAAKAAKMKEEVEQIDELSKSTLGSYVKKASTNARINSMISKDFDHKAMTARKPSTRDAYYGLSSKHKQKSWKRSDNVAKAVDRLAKEEVETTNESSAYGRISSRFKTLSGRSLDAAAKEHGDEAKKLQKEIEAQQKEIDRRKAAMKEEVKPMKPPFNAPYKKATGEVKDKSGAVHTAASRAKHLAKTGMKTQTPVKEGVFGALAGGVLGGLAGGPLGAAAGAYLGHKAQQAGNNAKEVNKKLKKEEVEQIDELSFNTLASYASKVDQKDKQPLSKKRQAGYNSAAERMSQKAQTADLKKWGKISDSVEYNFDNEGNLMPNPVSFKQFLDQLDEIKMADLPSRKVSGRGYGTEYYKKEAEKDKSGYDDEKKEKSEVKRGRGRPVGSTSGARQKGSSTGKKRSGVEMTGYPLHLPNKN